MSGQPSGNHDEAARPGVGAGAVPLEIAHSVMNAAIDNGDAAPLGQGTRWAASYRDAWWVEYENGWLRITDEATGRDLDHVAARLADVNAVTEGDVPGTRAAGRPNGLRGEDDGEAGTW